MNNNLNMIMNMLKGGRNPQQLVMNMMRNNSNPMLNNLMGMAQKGDNKGIENFARNIMKEQGRDFDKEFSAFRSNFKQG